MAFLELKNIGKIYVSEGNVAVGIRGVNLAFDKGEFVAVTGESGSGKSTLLNVISGMDSYEEGELLIEGQPTSHYLEPERERYREKYISFIFQNYNILDSFTVLQNVELALMESFPDPVKRRARAVGLLKRVGLGDKLKVRGSQLSGGQKQRTVIARALAKDSPVILADEPTGNLDSESAKEIIALLKEVSKDRLLIVVTHNIAEVAGYATREVRVFDGAVVSDRSLAAAPQTVQKSGAKDAQESGPADTKATSEVSSAVQSKKQAGTGSSEKKRSARAEKAAGWLRSIGNGGELGGAMFSATPKLTVFICLLMLLGTLGLLSITGECGKVPKLLASPTLFAPENGRLVVTRSDGAPLSEEELESLAKETGAVRTLHYDYLLDAFQNKIYENTWISTAEGAVMLALQPVYGQHFGEKLYGREPEAEDEVLLYLPISEKPEIGSGENFVREAVWCGLNYQVTGVQYYIDNTKTAKIVMTEDGFACALAAYLLQDAEKSVRVGYTVNGETGASKALDRVLPSFSVPEDRLYVSQESFTSELDSRTAAGAVPYADAAVTVYYRTNNSFFSQFMDFQTAFKVSETLPGDFYLRTEPDGLGEYVSSQLRKSAVMLVNADSLRTAMEYYLADVYTQASLFYESDKEAENVSASLRDRGYVSALSSDKYSPQAYETVINTTEGIMLLLLWVLTVIFLAFFINLCTGKAISAFRHDLAILRSMGIPVLTVISGLFTRLYMSLVPSWIFVIVISLVLYRTPKGNTLFPYLNWWQYLAVFIGMLLMATRVGFKQVKKLFGQSVLEALRGGDEA